VPEDITFVNGTSATSQNPEVAFPSAGDYEVTLEVSNLNGSSTLTKSNMVMAGGFPTYFIEEFETDGMKTNEWSVENPDDNITWELFETGGTTPGNHSVGINFREYYAIGQRDYLISPPFNLMGTSTPSLEFQYAYAQYYPEAGDSLIVSVSTDCGTTWSRLYANAENGSGNFATHELTTDDWWPMISSDWCMEGWGAGCIILDLTPFAGNDQVRVRFETFSFAGNPLVIDNIAVSSLVGTPENVISRDELVVFPNPSDGNFHITLPEGHQFDQIQVVNSMGKVVKEFQISKEEESLVVSRNVDWNAGLYFLRGVGAGQSKSIKLIIY
jgi:hypothetical protein